MHLFAQRYKSSLTRRSEVLTPLPDFIQQISPGYQAFDTLACTKLTSKRRTLMNCLQKNTIAWKGWKGMIQFLAAEGVGGREMHRWIKAVYDEYSLCRSSVVEWRKTFLEGCEYWKTMLDMERLIVLSYQK
ncbi:hypothetical protein TNCV_3150021 [Trichonephila clavipes]|nr:hypothetical protein TNCV_3150021 [Trichonephila clavipes]